MDRETTLIWLCIGLACAVAGGLGGVARRRAPLAWHAHVPWDGIAFAGVTVALFAAVHLNTVLRLGG